MKHFTLKRLTLCVMALLAVGAVNAATETYDFTGFANNTTTTAGTENKGKVNNQNVNLLQLGAETFNNRFAVSRVGGNAGSAWVAKNYEDQKGLYTVYNDRYFTILNLKDGDQITITWSTDGDGTLKFFDAPAIAGKSASDAVENGTTYTISTGETSVNVNLFADGTSNSTKLYIKSVVIKTPTTSESISIGQSIQYYNLEDIESTTNITSIDPITANGTEYSRFSTQQQNCFQISGSGWGFQVNYNKWFSINNLKAGDKIWIRYTKSDGQTVNFEDATLIGETGTVELVSETWYTLAKDADKLKLVNQVNTNGKKANYLDVKIISINTSITATTLVSTKALDFTGTDVNAYIATGTNETSVVMEQKYKIPANTPVYITATTGGYYTIPLLEGDADDVRENKLMAGANAKIASDATYTYYVYGVKSGVAGFYKVSASGITVPTGKAYLQTDTPTTARDFLDFTFGEQTTTAINAIEQQRTDGVFYNMAGQRIQNPTRGLYIVNGKKVIIK